MNKNVLSKIITVLQITALIVFFILVFFLLFNCLVAYKTASTNDWISFGGGIAGSIIAGLIAVITFRYTIKNTNENQEKAHKLQMSLKVEDNLKRKMETERSVLATTYNHLENFLYTVSCMLNQNDNYIEMKNDYLRLYNEVLSSINNIRFNSEIFDDRSQCENCSMCEIKTYGTLVKFASDIQKEMLVIDEECRIVLSYLEAALNTAAQNKQLIDENTILQQVNANNPTIAEIKCLFDSNLKIIGEQVSLARNKAAQIDAKNKTQLYILIRKYFYNYNLYINEVVFSVQKNGKKLNRGCAKIDFEKNHTENTEI